MGTKYIDAGLAKILKKKGFNEPTVYNYIDGNGDTIGRNKDFAEFRNSEMSNACSAPTYYEVIDFLRNSYNRFIEITIDFSDSVYPMYDCCVVNLETCEKHKVIGYNIYSYIDCIKTAVKYTLKNLI